MGSSRELLCLRWEDFGTHFSGSFKKLRSQSAPQDSFFDVSLVASDGEEVLQAHKVILSTCSPFFSSVLSKQSRSSPGMGGMVHPVIYLRGVTAQDLRNVLDFMYHGEVNVAQEDLDAFLATAEDLKVKGLTQGNDAGAADNGNGSQDYKPPKLEGGTPAKRPLPPPSSAPPHPPKRQKVIKRPSQARPPPPSSSRLQPEDDDIEIIKSEPPSSSAPPPPRRQSKTSGLGDVVDDPAAMMDPPPQDDLGGYHHQGEEEDAGHGEEDYGNEDYGYAAEESGDMVYAEEGGQLVGGQEDDGGIAAGVGEVPKGEAKMLYLELPRFLFKIRDFAF